MDRTISVYLWIAIVGTVLLNALAQIFLRIGMRGVELVALFANREYGTIFGFMINPNVVSGLSCYGFSVLLWM